jgi:hypothetical protein
MSLIDISKKSLEGKIKLPPNGKVVFVDVSKVPKLEETRTEYCGKCDAVRSWGYFKVNKTEYKTCEFCGNYVEL